MQLRHLAERAGHRYNRILKARQFGFTTLYCIDYLDEALWVPGMSCAILAHEQKYNEKIFSIVKRAYDNLPDLIKPETKTNTKYQYEFTHRFDGSLLDSSIYVATDVRSGTVQKLHITEAAWLKDPAKVDAGAKQAVPKTGSITEETTANGFNDFYDKYNESLNKTEIGPQDYKAYFYPWYENPEYVLPGQLPAITQDDLIKYGDEKALQKEYGLSDGQLLWRRWKINELRQSNRNSGLSGVQLFMQEYPATIEEAFQSGLGNIFSVAGLEAKEPLKLQPLLDQVRPENYDELEPHVKKQIDEVYIPKIQALYKLGVKFWKAPEYGRTYVIGVDPSDGTGSDYGDVDVWDKEANEQVAQYYSNYTRPDALAEIAAELGWLYNEAFIGVENNLLSCILFLVKIYGNYFFETQIDKKTLKRTKKIGWSTNTKTRDPMIDDYIKLYEDDGLIINSQITIDQMRTFVKKDNGKREHADGKQDDALIASMIAQQMRKLEPRKARALSQKPF